MADLERVNITDRAEAIRALRDWGADWGMEPELQEIHMRYGPPETDGQRACVESWGCEEAWWECSGDHPAAVPFWKDAP